MHAGASRNDSKPGMYGKSTLRLAVVVSIIEKSEVSITTAAGEYYFTVFAEIAQSRPVIPPGFFLHRDKTHL